jgi:Na+/glutamate symporter
VLLLVLVLVLVLALVLVLVLVMVMGEKYDKDVWCGACDVCNLGAFLCEIGIAKYHTRTQIHTV